MEESTDRSNAQITPGGEWLRFGVMAVILIGTILVIMLLRPMIFGRIVPAIMGEGISALGSLSLGELASLPRFRREETIRLGEDVLETYARAH